MGTSDERCRAPGARALARRLGTAVGLVLAFSCTTARAAPCERVLPDAPLWWCPDAASEESALRFTTRPLRVAPTEAPLQTYRHLVFEVAKAAKLTPLLFPGAPVATPAESEARDDSKAPAHLRHLTGGYLYTTDEDQARQWHRGLQLHEVYNTPKVTIRRGDAYFTVSRRSYGYFHTEGPMEGRRASILLLDQVAPTRDSLPPPAAFDLLPLRRQIGARTFDVRSLSPSRVELVARLANGATFELTGTHDGTRTVFFTRSGPDVIRKAIQASRLDTDEQYAITDAARDMTAERLRFDEPKTEFGQQDGLLRREWSRAYYRGAKKYVVNGDAYDVYDRAGRPYPPQVCIDYIVDAIDRAGGSWFNPRGKRPRREQGLIELRRWPDYRSRSVADTVRLASENPDMWDLYTMPDERRIPWREREAFRAQLNAFPTSLQEADTIVIYGKRDDGRNHYHTYFVYRTDPIHGVPVSFADNAGWANLRVVDDIMKVAPRRYILHRLRLRPDWIRARKEAVLREREALADAAGAPGNRADDSAPDEAPPPLADDQQ